MRVRAIVAVVLLAAGLATAPASSAATTPTIHVTRVGHARAAIPVIDDVRLREMTDEGYSVPVCVSETFCVGADVHGNVDTWNGSRWSSSWVDRTNVAGFPNLKIDCPTTTMCMAVDVGLNGFVWSHGAWSGPIRIAPSLDPGTNHVIGLSCATPSFCVALTDSTEAIVFDGTSWHAPVPNAQSLGSIVLDCPATDYCLTVGSDTSMVFDGATWSAPQAISTDDSDRFGRVSCASATSCVAAGYLGATAEWDGTTWTPVTGWPADHFLADLDCATADFCAATAGGRNSDENYLLYLDHGRWTTPVPTDLAWLRCVSETFCLGGTYAPDGEQELTKTIVNGVERTVGRTPPPTYPFFADVSCPTTSFCMAVDLAGHYTRYANGVWSSLALIAIGSQRPGAVSLSCTSSRFCLLLDSQNRALRWNGSGWQRTERSGSTLTHVSCATATFCMGVSATPPTTSVYNGRTWSLPRRISTGALGGVSCPSAGFCLVQDTERDNRGYVRTYRHGTWSRPTLLSDNGLYAIDCASPTFCAASVADVELHGLGAVRYYNGRTWSGIYLYPTGLIGQLDCRSSKVCVGVFDNDKVFAFTQQAVSPAVLFPFGVNAMSCPTASGCQAVWQYGTFRVRFVQ